MSCIRVRIKICGITSVADAMAAVDAGADALGFVFYEPSPRAVSIEEACSIARELPPFVTTVGLFVNAPASFVETAVDRVRLDLLQFHGDETAEQCRLQRRPYIKAIRMQPDTNLDSQASDFSDAAGLLLDTFVPGIAGGTGQTFDWRFVPRNRPKPIVLAGGLTPDNVAKAVALVEPFAVDVSGGVELSKGVKDPARMRAFVEGVRHGERI